VSAPIVWLASYPKSGNTWIRAVLTSYLRGAPHDIDLNDLEGGPIASARHTFDELCGLDSADLTREEIDVYRPAMYEVMAAEREGPFWLKVHDAYRLNARGKPIFPAEVTRGAVYIIRNPLDVVVSWAHHRAISIDASIEALNQHDHDVDSSLSHPSRQLPQRLGSWSQHVRSWVDDSGLPVVVVRYEDMHANPHATFTRVVEAAGMAVDADRLADAIRSAAFSRLQERERAHGFSEAPAHGRFFRQGQVGSWRACLTPAHVRAIAGAHQSVMARFGYVTGGEPLADR
jgi:hypothetical protein